MIQGYPFSRVHKLSFSYESNSADQDTDTIVHRESSFCILAIRSFYNYIKTISNDEETIIFNVATKQLNLEGLN